MLYIYLNNTINIFYYYKKCNEPISTNLSCLMIIFHISVSVYYRECSNTCQHLSVWMGHIWNVVVVINLCYMHVNTLLGLDVTVSRFRDTDLKRMLQKSSRGYCPLLITGAWEAVPGCKRTGIRQMSNLGHIQGDIPQTRAKPGGSEACHCTEIIHVLITLPVYDFDAELLLSSQLSALRSTLSNTAWILHSEQTPRHISKGTFLSSVLIPHCLDYAHVNLSIKLHRFSMSLDGLFIAQARDYTAIIWHLDIVTNWFSCLINQG